MSCCSGAVRSRTAHNVDHPSCEAFRDGAECSSSVRPQPPKKTNKTKLNLRYEPNRGSGESLLRIVEQVTCW